MRHVTAKLESVKDGRATISFGGGLLGIYAQLGDKIELVSTEWDRPRLDEHLERGVIGKRAIEKGRKVAEEALRKELSQTVTSVEQSTELTEDELFDQHEAKEPTAAKKLETWIDEEAAKVIPAHISLFSTWLGRNYRGESVVMYNRHLNERARMFLEHYAQSLPYHPLALARALRKERAAKAAATRADNNRADAKRLSALTPESAKHMKKILAEAKKAPKQKNIKEPEQQDLFL